MLGFHPAELPNNRGRHPLIWALVLGLDKTASTFFQLDEHADSGNIVSQKKLSIDYEDDARTLYDKIMNVAIEQLKEIYKNLNEKSLISIEQDKNAGNSWRKRSKIDGQIDENFCLEKKGRRKAVVQKKSN